jgi:hypothetical protein
MTTHPNRASEKLSSLILIAIGIVLGVALSVATASIGPSVWSKAKFAMWIEFNNPYPSTRVLNISKLVYEVDHVLVNTKIQQAEGYVNDLINNDSQYSRYFDSISIIGEDEYDYSVAYELRDIGIDECESLASYDGLYILDSIRDNALYKALEGRIEFKPDCQSSLLTVVVKRS